MALDEEVVKHMIEVTLFMLIVIYIVYDNLFDD